MPSALALFQEFPLGVEVSVEVIPGRACPDAPSGDPASRPARELIPA